MARMRQQRGQTAVETVLMVPLLLLLFFLIFEIGRVFGSWLIITNSAREGARFAVVQTFNPPDDSIAAVQARVQQTSQFLTVNASSCTGSYDSCIEVAPPTQAAPPAPATERVVTVVVRYRVYTLTPINGNIPFLGEFNYPGFLEVVGISTMRWE